jgi:polyketide cyclase/dehydrase/lipid transport protein
MLAKILAAFVVVAVVLVVMVAMRPAEFRIARTATIPAPVPVVFGHVNDFHRWEAWSPWARRDPGMKKTFEGAPAGAGAVYSWAGNHDVGEGRSTIVESRPNELIRIKLEFVRPFKATNTAEFAFRPEDDRTVITWSLAGRHNFLGKAVGLVMNMDRMIGGNFEKGLADLKRIAEGGSRG